MNLENSVKTVESAIEPHYGTLAKVLLGVAAVLLLGVGSIAPEGARIMDFAFGGAAIAGLGALVCWERAVLGECRRCGVVYRSDVRFCSQCGQRSPLLNESISVEDDDVERVESTPFDD